MDAAKVLTIQKLYREHKISFFEAGLMLTIEGCTPQEADLLLFPDSLAEMSDETAQALGEYLDALPKPVIERPEDCICSNQSYEDYGCTCRKRIQPG